MKRPICVCCLALWSFSVGGCEDASSELLGPASYEAVAYDPAAVTAELTEAEWDHVLANSFLEAHVYPEPMGAGSYPNYKGIAAAYTGISDVYNPVTGFLIRYHSTVEHTVYVGWNTDMRPDGGGSAGTKVFQDNFVNAAGSAKLNRRYEIEELNCGATPFGGLNAHSYNRGTIRAVISASANDEPDIVTYELGPIRYPQNGVAGPALCDAPILCSDGSFANAEGQCPVEESINTSGGHGDEDCDEHAIIPCGCHDEEYFMYYDNNGNGAYDDGDEFIRRGIWYEVCS